MKDKKIPQRWRRVISLLFRELILITPPRKGFSWSVKRLSRELQRQFIEKYEFSHERFLEKFFQRMEPYLSLQVHSPIDIEGVTHTIEWPAPDKREYFMSKVKGKGGKDFLSRLTEIFVICDERYSPWGCTPKLAFDPTDGRTKQNCFGRAIVLGAYCVRQRIRVDMGITPDHPLVIAYLGSGVYAMDNRGKAIKLNGTFEKYGTYKIYRPVEKELESFTMIMVHPFDQALLYEMFENMEVLRRVSLGMECALLPKTRLATIAVAKQYAEVLTLAKWKELQTQLFPEITISFARHRGEWKNEVARIVHKRDYQYLDHISSAAATLAQKETSFDGKDFESSQDALREIFKDYCTDIMLYLWTDVAFSQEVPNDVCNYFRVFREEMEKADKEDSGVAERIYRIIEMKLVDMKIKEKYKETNSLVT